jgi:hypothetical protein
MLYLSLNDLSITYVMVSNITINIAKLSMLYLRNDEPSMIIIHILNNLMSTMMNN